MYIYIYIYYIYRLSYIYIFIDIVSVKLAISYNTIIPFKILAWLIIMCVITRLT